VAAHISTTGNCNSISKRCTRRCKGIILIIDILYNVDINANEALQASRRSPFFFYLYTLILSCKKMKT